MRYYVIAGEASGDLHGSNLLKGLYREDPKAVIRFWGGGRMEEVYKNYSKGDDDGGLVVDYKEGAVMGFAEVIAKGGKLLGNLKACKEDILNWSPDVVILIDYPGFNMKIARFAHQNGIKVFYYIAPKTWASRESRNKKIKKYVDKLFIVFPFEKAYFDARGMDYIYCGNPLIDAVDDSPSMKKTREDFFSTHKIKDCRYVALLAGSRKNEIARMMPVYMQVADRLHSIPKYEEMNFIVAAAPARSLDDYSSSINGRDYVYLVFDDTYGVLRHAEAAVINSGTASLEAVLIGTPQVVGYTFAKLTGMIAKLIVKVKYISLANLIIDRFAFRELTLDNFNVDTVFDEVLRLLEDEDYKNEMLDSYDCVRKALGGSGASDAVARAMITEIKKWKNTTEE